VEVVCRNVDGEIGDCLARTDNFAVYVGETRGVYEVAGDSTGTPKPELMPVARSHGSDACAQTTL